MVTLKDKQILIDGVPQNIMCGEVHYFRLKKSQWQPALDGLKECGCTAVASYIPWFCHEYQEGDFDTTGRYREEHDLAAFLELCQKNGLYFVARPGPFIMAEVKNEGVPYWVYENYPQVIPTTWGGRYVTTKTLDYTHPDFLSCAKRWYNHIIPLLAKYSQPNGGNLITVQLDNEIGMLSWVSNSPDLTDYSLDCFIEWVSQKYGDTSNRYGMKLEKNDATHKLLRDPNESIALKYHKDLGYFMRKRFADYVRELRTYAVDNGIKDIPFLINIHGSGGYRGTGYPIGISQLYESYQGIDDIYSGSDFYIGAIDIGNFQDIYLGNIFTDCMNSNNQPLSSMEFEAGDADYGDCLGSRTSPTGIDIKTRMFVAQGNRMLNYYLFSGGENYRLPDKRNDGNDRIAFTGQKHGFAAPLNPLLKKTSTYDRTKSVVEMMTACARPLSTMTPDTDNVVFSFIPDYYMIEYHYPDSQSEKKMLEELQYVRDWGGFGVLAKSLLLTNRSFTALDIQHNDITEKLGKDTVLALVSCSYMSCEIQRNICNFIDNGGNVFLYGNIPLYDMEGNECTLLADKLKVKCVGKMQPESPHFYPSVYPCGFASEYFETRSAHTQFVETDGDIFIRAYPNDEICGFRKEIGASKIVAILTDYHAVIPLFDELYNYLGISKRFSTAHEFNALLALSTSNSDGESFVHFLNIDDFEKNFDSFKDGKPLFDDKLFIGPRRCLMLPFNVKLGDGISVTHATAEIIGSTEHSVTFRLTQRVDKIELKTAHAISINPSCDMVKNGNCVVINAEKYLLNSDTITVTW